MVLFTQYVQWQNYIASDFADAEIVEARAEAKVRYEEQTAMLSSDNDKVTLARAELNYVPSVERAREVQMQAYARRKMLQMMASNCERCAQLISRELSRRIGREPLERRQMRWNP